MTITEDDFTVHYEEVEDIEENNKSYYCESDEDDVFSDDGDITSNRPISVYYPLFSICMPF